LEENIMQISDLVPPISLPDINGNTWHPSSAEGRILVLNFWSAECPHSKRVDEVLSPNLKQWGDRVVYAVVNSNANEAMDLIQTTSRERHLQLVLLDRQQTLANFLDARTTPHFFVFDIQGLLVYQGGFDDTSFRQRTATRLYLVEAVNALLSGQDPAIKESPPYGCSIVRFSGIMG
jgi:thiol-disulfide isomerase/thioredoxin